MSDIPKGTSNQRTLLNLSKVSKLPALATGLKRLAASVFSAGKAPLIFWGDVDAQKEDAKREVKVKDKSHLSKMKTSAPQKKLGTRASYPALRLEQNNQIFYFVTIPVWDIFPYCFVARRQEDPQEGFQRLLSAQRAEDIAAYLDNSVGSIPTNIVLSSQIDVELEYVAKTKSIKYTRAPKGFLVLDGQHRLYGYGQTKKLHRVPVAIYQGLSRKEEAALFIDINTNQRGVPAALLLDIKHVAEKESEVESSLRQIFNELNDDSDSPLCGLLSPATSSRGKVSRVTFNRGVSQILENSVFSKVGEKKQYQLIRNYFSAVESSLHKPSLLVKSAYFEAFCGLFDDVMRISRTKYQDFKQESLTNVLAPIRNVDIETLVTGGKTKVTKSTILPVLKQSLTGQIDVTEDMI